MLKHLKFDVTFPTTGRQFSGDHSFEDGLTAIVGPNEAGKSLILEMIRFALHGSKALRTTTSKYKGLKVELDFSVKGSVYKIVRTLSKATLSDTNSNVTAVGTSAVNVKIAEIFGYGLDVFDASHSVNQGQIEALGAMAPAERKRMVDNVIGLNVLDALIENTGKIANGYNKDAETLQSALVIPVVPAKPEGYRCSTALSADIKAENKLVAERNQILGQLRSAPVPAVFPDPLPFTATVEELELVMKQRSELQKRIDVLGAQYNALPTTKYSMQELDEIKAQITAWEIYEEYEGLMRARGPLPDPSMPWERIKGQREYLSKYHKWEAEVEKWNRHKTECPECHHVWVEKMAKPADTMEAPEFTREELDAYGRPWIMWEGLHRPEPVAKPETKPPFSVVQLKWHYDAIGAAVKRQNLADDIAISAHALTEMPDVSPQLKQRREYDQRLAIAEALQSVFDEFQDNRIALDIRLVEIGNADGRFAELQRQMNEASLYEGLLQNFKDAQQRFQELSAKVAVAQAQATSYTKARKALVILKSLVKAHLVPSLNTVASLLLAQMTGGQRSKIECNEDFDIKVDGQDIDELSGSAKAVANLAIRLGLGQVLTNRVFPVFMGDELDAAMDNERAGFTAECLQGLTGRIKQVISVTHKRTGIADHLIDLGEAA